MKNIFKNSELDSKAFSKIYGGFDEKKTSFSNPDGSKGCDTHDDKNNDGKVDVGEKFCIVECISA